MTIDELIILKTYLPTHLIDYHHIGNLPTYPFDELISGQPQIMLLCDWLASDT